MSAERQVSIHPFEPSLFPVNAYLVETATGVVDATLGVFMYPTSSAGTSKASQAYWQVDDVEAELAELKARGVVFEHYEGMSMRNSIATGGGAKTAWFKDTEETSWPSARASEGRQGPECHNSR